MDQSSEVFYNLILFGSAALFLMALAVVVFFLSYQRKVLQQQLFQFEQEKKQRHELQQQELRHQREVFEAMLQAQEEEQRRIAGDLHDEIGPQLSLIKLRAGALPRKVKDLAEIKPQADAITAMLSETIASIRKISHDLMPTVVENLGIIEALHYLADEVSANSEVTFTFRAENDHALLLEKRYEIALYRIVQELLQNSLKHAQAQHITLTFAGTEQELVIIYSDDGVGFDAGALPAKEGGLGLRNLVNRVHLLGGRQVIETAPGKGFSVTISIPFDYFIQSS